ncbi:adenylate cyclase, putative [Babesia ovata]|uniref:Adenylate cyclase, putative n=1 Tax=Babesia ovata TaxID=189622 RepID=A0A2H6K6H2_9APIC|nr:adenylate cyclase, putative [Babesia ovata]GBE58580.1 adenylate cyclase, putative [Babesia ovata]
MVECISVDSIQANSAVDMGGADSVLAGRSEKLPFTDFVFNIAAAIDEAGALLLFEVDELVQDLWVRLEISLPFPAFLEQVPVQVIGLHERAVQRVFMLDAEVDALPPLQEVGVEVLAPEQPYELRQLPYTTHAVDQIAYEYVFVGVVALEVLERPCLLDVTVHAGGERPDPAFCGTRTLSQEIRNKLPQPLVA